MTSRRNEPMICDNGNYPQNYTDSNASSASQQNPPLQQVCIVVRFPFVSSQSWCRHFLFVGVVLTAADEIDKKKIGEHFYVFRRLCLKVNFLFTLSPITTFRKECFHFPSLKYNVLWATVTELVNHIPHSHSLFHFFFYNRSTSSGHIFLVQILHFCFYLKSQNHFNLTFCNNLRGRLRSRFFFL